MHEIICRPRAVWYRVREPDAEPAQVVGALFVASNSDVGCSLVSRFRLCENQ